MTSTVSQAEVTPMVVLGSSSGCGSHMVGGTNMEDLTIFSNAVVVTTMTTATAMAVVNPIEGGGKERHAARKKRRWSRREMKKEVGAGHTVNQGGETGDLNQSGQSNGCGKYGHSIKSYPMAKANLVHDEGREDIVGEENLVQQVPQVHGAWADVSDDENAIAENEEARTENDGDNRSRMSELEHALMEADQQCTGRKHTWD
ncbi:hypothetical protein NE237_029196 [Protea cynaroides]|uniref:Uncharacterized protein n=1 Tax=Protea cynaroides TaxID=273540 RepID=A0A9Q0GRQ9_9MAGN|nr:hypothetical protein NE237_029196 [Protea cynaroides]